MKFDITSNHFEAATMAMSKDQVRIYLCGVKFEEGFMISADGYQLIRVAAPIPAGVDFIMDAITVKRVLAMSKEANKLHKVALQIQFDTEENKVWVLDDKITIGKVDGTFPDWRRVLPSEFGPQESVGVDTDYLANLGKAGRIHSGHKRGRLKLTMNASSGGPIQLTNGLDDGFYAVLMPTRIV
jgi:DNA polymerase III sliding clamp (beta) subunit (PCNA family)